MDRASYCDIHGTYPIPNEPCWQCANPFIEKAVALLEQRVEGLEEFARLIVEYAKTHDELLAGDERDWETEALEIDKELSMWLSLGEDALAQQERAQ